MSAIQGDPARLLVTTPAGTQEFRLDRDRMVLGRGRGSDILVDDKMVSRRHSELQKSGAGYAIVDLQSMNGLVMGGQRIAQRTLVDGDEIRIGQTVTLRYVASAAERAAATAPPAAPAPVPAAAASPAGWYADPWGVAALRYWDGLAWTEHLAAHPVTTSMPSAPAVPVAPATPGPPVPQPARSLGLTAPDRPARGVAFLGVAAVLVLAGSFLPWLGRDGRTASSWDLPILSLLKGQVAGGVRTGLLLLLVAVVAAALAAAPYVMRTSPHPAITYLLAVVPINAATSAVIASLRATPDLALGPGALVTLAGGVLLSIEGLLSMARRHAASRARRA